MDMYQFRFQICSPDRRPIARRITVGLPGRAIRNLGPIGVPDYARYGSLECRSRSGMSGGCIAARRSRTPSRLPDEAPRAVLKKMRESK